MTLSFDASSLNILKLSIDTIYTVFRLKFQYFLRVACLRGTQQIKNDGSFFVKPSQPFGRSVHDVFDVRPDNVIEERHQQLLVVKQPLKAEIRQRIDIYRIIMDVARIRPGAFVFCLCHTKLCCLMNCKSMPYFHQFQILFCFSAIRKEKNRYRKNFLSHFFYFQKKAINLQVK